MRKTLSILFVIFVTTLSFGTAMAACTSDQIDVAGDGTNCVDTKFSLTTTATNTFQFTMSAQGTFYVDCGNGGTLTSDSATNYPVNGTIVNRTSGTSNVTYTCTWSDSAVQTIKFSGTATYYSWTTSVAAISFWVGSSDSNKNSNAQKIASVSGNLSSMFPYNTNLSSNYPQPRFYQTFKYAKTLTSVPDTLFANYTNGSTYMFYQTFHSCWELTSLPEKLFGNITTGAEYMFYQTFYNCVGLTSLTEKLFGNITTGAQSMFYQTFYNCASMGGYIPPSTFAGLIATGSPIATYMWNNAFYGTRLKQNCSSGTTEYPTGYKEVSNGWGSYVSCVSLSPMEITLDTTGATTTGSPNTVYIKYNTGWYSDSDGNNAITQLTTLPTKTGYVFGGFYTGENGTGTMVIDSDGNFLTSALYEPTTLYAYFGTGYDVTYSCGDGDGTPPSNRTAVSGSQFFTPTNTCSKSGYFLIGWAVSGTNDIVGNRFVWNYNENKTLTAQYAEEKFTLTTKTRKSFQFKMSAQGTFYVDCGNGGILTSDSATNYPVNGTIVNRTYGTSNVTYTCTWSDSAIQTIKFGGIATNYNTDRSAAISFYTDTGGLSSISGNLSAMFPYNTNAAQNGAQPRFTSTFYLSDISSIPGTLFANYTIGSTYMFEHTFNGNKLITSIPDNLFSGFTTGAEYMFSHTFSGCTRLTSVPGNMFGGLTTGAQSMFYGTFSECPRLTSIPGNMFGNITAGAQSMFLETFYNCTGLTSIPEKLFDSFTTGAKYMFNYTFRGCTGLTSIPGNMFGNITTGAQYMFLGTFYNCKGLTSLPEKLFSSFTTAPVNQSMFADMFASTFYGCTGLTTLPEKLFSSFTIGYTFMFYNTFSGCTGLTSLPEKLFSSFTAGAQSMFYGTFQGCTGLTSLPEKLFSSFTTGNDSMFSNTFSGCSNITGYIPPSTFAGLIAAGSPTATDMWSNTFYNTGLAQNSCPSGTTEYPTGYKGVTNGWGNYVSCFENTAHTCSAGEYLPKMYTSCVTCPAGKYCTGGSYSFSPYNDQGMTGDCSAGTYSAAGASSCSACPTGYNDSAAGATTENQCFKSCNAADFPHSAVVTGSDYYGDGIDTCVIASCATGYSVTDGACTLSQYTCSAGQYLDAGATVCTACPANSSCTGGTYTFNETTPQGKQSCETGAFSPSASAVCYPHILHVGDDNIYLKSTKQTTPSLNFRIGNDMFYANMTTVRTKMNKDSDHYFRTQWENNDYYVCDDTTCPQ